MNSIQKRRRRIYISAGLFLAAMVVPRLLIFQPFRQRSEIMLPTIHPGDIVVINRWSYHFHPPAHGDVAAISFRDSLSMSSKPRYSILRIVGLAGDLIEVRDGILRRNGRPINEPYLYEPGHIGYTLKPYKVPAGMLFIMGDNRNNSFDSHSYGPVIASRALGKMWLCVRSRRP